MRIAFVTTEYITEPDSFDGGLSNYLHKVSLNLVAAGHEPVIIVKSDKTEQIIRDGIKVYRVKPKTPFLYKLADKLTRFKFQKSLDIITNSYYLNKKLREIHKINKIDLVQYPNFNSLSLFSQNKINSVLRISSYQKLWDEANGLNYNSIIERQAQIMEKICYRKARNIFGPSEFLAKVINEEFLKTVTLIETPFQPVNIKLNFDLLNEIHETTGDNKYILFFGRLALFKGVIDIAEILKPFFIKNPNYYFVIIGQDIGYNMGSTLDYIYEKVGDYKNRVLYFKEQPHEQLMAVIKNAHIVLLPSRIENFPNACVEAMSLNKIVIATRGVSFEQLITDKVNGFLCENANPNDLLRVIEEVINLPKENLSAVKQNAGKTVERLHPDITVKKLIAYYESILKK